MSQQQSNRMTNNLCIARTIARVIILMGLRDVEVRTEDKGATLLIILQLLLLLNLLSMKLTWKSKEEEWSDSKDSKMIVMTNRQVKRRRKYTYLLQKSSTRSLAQIKRVNVDKTLWRIRKPSKSILLLQSIEIRNKLEMASVINPTYKIHLTSHLPQMMRITKIIRAVKGKETNLSHLHPLGQETNKLGACSELR